LIIPSALPLILENDKQQRFPADTDRNTNSYGLYSFLYDCGINIGVKQMTYDYNRCEISMKIKDAPKKWRLLDITDESQVYKLLEKMSDYDRENFVAIYLDSRNTLIAIHTISIGTLNASLVHPREIFKPALLCSAAAIILAHNHPSGDPEPSDADIELTNQIKKAGEVIGIELLDHIIIGRGSYKSLRNSPLMSWT